ncbi:MAG: transposase [Planctomycetota bacterium]
MVSYLARYANRVVIANDRLIKIEDGEVFFSYKDAMAFGAIMCARKTWPGSASSRACRRWRLLTRTDRRRASGVCQRLSGPKGPHQDR